MRDLLMFIPDKQCVGWCLGTLLIAIHKQQMGWNNITANNNFCFW